MNIVVEFFVVTFKVLWAFVLAAARWLVRPKEKSVAGQVCLITGAGSGLGRLFALEFARRRALLVLWDINTQSNEETAGMVRHIYRDLEAADAAALQGKLGVLIRERGHGAGWQAPQLSKPKRALPHTHTLSLGKKKLACRCPSIKAPPWVKTPLGLKLERTAEFWGGP